MATQNILNATIADVEAALIEQYGRPNVREGAKSNAQAVWTFRITSKSQGKCTATPSADGVTLTMAPSTHVAFWIATAVGYVCFILPGVMLTLIFLGRRFVTARVLDHRGAAMIESVERHVMSRG